MKPISYDNSKSVVCIVGMHRSGTSMIARLLSQCGLYLGPQEQLLGASEGNPLGHYEHQRFLEIDDGLLAHFGGSAFAPPKLAKGWEKEPALAQFIERAEALLQTFQGHSPWGWKEPRTTLLLPFWKALIPNLRFVICVRNPVEVADSVTRRQIGSFEKGLWLWNEYTLAALRETENFPRRVVFYDDFFQNGNGEIDKLVEFCGLAKSAGCVTTAGIVRQDLRHHRHGIDKLLGDHRVSAEHKLLYFGLRVLVLEESRALSQIPDAEHAITKSIANYLTLLASFHDSSQVAQMRTAIDLRDREIENLAADAERLANEKERLTLELRGIKETLFWRLSVKARSWVERLFPMDTSRRAAYDSFLKKIKSGVDKT